MHDKAIAAGDSPTAKQDIRDQGITLMHVLHRHPTLLTVPDLIREITAGSEDFAEGDAVVRAVRDLAGVGLLRRTGGLAVPSPAALRFLAILQGGHD